MEIGINSEQRKLTNFKVRSLTWDELPFADASFIAFRMLQREREVKTVLTKKITQCL